ncbi:MAG: hypothetical protein RID53_29365 [Coleofasciculus sp. B1-GNL1-01]|uniref:hypothetical protein n=1 Tax=Coleofasciculus sp. B1-GNL1-01 TaxID=3068484 RepID=UPI00330125D6
MNPYKELKLAPGMRSRLKPDNNSHTQQHKRNSTLLKNLKQTLANGICGILKTKFAYADYPKNQGL